MKFDSADQVVDFVNVVSKYDADFKLSEERLKVNAKSLLGVFTLDFTKPLLLCYNSQDEKIRKKISPFMYKKERKLSCV